MSKATNHIIIPAGKPKHWKRLRLPPSYIANIYNQFLVWKGFGSYLEVWVDPQGNSEVSIKYADMQGETPETGRKYLIEFNMDDGRVYLECKVEKVKAIEKAYSLFMTSNQPPTSWVNKK